MNEIYKYCLNNNVQLVINNDYSIARSYEGAGVHVGRKDLSIKSIKNIIGSETLIGYCFFEILFSFVIYVSNFILMTYSSSEVEV